MNSINFTHKTDLKLDCEIVHFPNANFKLDSGDSINDIKIAFKTFGELNTKKDNAILVCHALTGDQYVSGMNPVTGREGWWSRMVGPNKPIDTNKFFVICSNVLGGCSGSTGPKEINLTTKKIYGRDFPSITMNSIFLYDWLITDLIVSSKYFSPL